MEYLDLWRMTEEGYTSTKAPFRKQLSAQAFKVYSLVSLCERRIQNQHMGCVSFRRLRPPEVSFEGCIRHRGCLISEKQVGPSECDLRMCPSFTRIRRMHQVYPSLLQITHNSLRRRKPSLIRKMPAPADVHTSADVSFQLKSASSKNG